MRRTRVPVAGAGLPVSRLAVCALTLVVVVGCASYSGPADGLAPSAAAVQHPTLTGIPLPNGFVFVPERSLYFASGPVRGGVHEFAGSTEIVSVYRFYKDYMPEAGFTLRDENMDRGVYYLRFDNGTEECTIKLMREKGKTVLVIRTGPLPQAGSERKPATPPRPPTP